MFSRLLVPPPRLLVFLFLPKCSAQHLSARLPYYCHRNFPVVWQLLSIFSCFYHVFGEIFYESYIFQFPPLTSCLCFCILSFPAIQLLHITIQCCSAISSPATTLKSQFTSNCTFGTLHSPLEKTFHLSSESPCAPFSLQSIRYRHFFSVCRTPINCLSASLSPMP